MIALLNHKALEAQVTKLKSNKPKKKEIGLAKVKRSQLQNPSEELLLKGKVILSNL
jgi:hypothetical protein